MRCSKCGEQCSDNQAFCLKCGSPIQLMADFNLIEKELASSIDEFMNEMEQEATKLPEEADESDDMKTIDVPLDEINMQLKLVDINRDDEDGDLEEPFDEEDYDEELMEADITPVHMPDKRPEQRKKNVRKSQKKSNKKPLIIGGILVIIAIVAIVVGVMLFGNKDKEDVVKDYAYYYSNAEASYNKSSYDDALDMALKAVELAGNDADRIKSRTLVKLIYESQNFKGKYYIENLEELFYMGENSKENILSLLNCYVEQGDTEGFLKIYEIIDEETAKECLGDNYAEKPQTDLPAGQYNNFITLELSAQEGCQIYYAVTEASSETGYAGTAYTLYENAIEITELGQYTVMAYAVNQQGVLSYIAEFDYSIVEGEAEGPEITPVAGTYTEPTQITIQIPDGAKAYYTYDGTVPDENSTEYTEPVDMLRGVNTFKAIIVDKYGNVSETTSAQYNLRVPRNETLTSGKDKVWAYYLNSGVIDTNGNQADGSVISISYYDLRVIDNVEYYIYQVVAVSADGTSTTAISCCVVDTYDGSVIAGVVQAGDDFVIPEIEETDN